MFTDNTDPSAFLPTGTLFNAKTCYPNIYDRVQAYWTLSIEDIGLELIIF